MSARRTMIAPATATDAARFDSRTPTPTPASPERNTNIRHDHDAEHTRRNRDRDRDRDSNALRASVLDAAMLLGVGASRTLQHWIFDEDGDADGEDDEDEDGLRTPLTAPAAPPPLGRLKSIYREDFDAATLASYILDRDVAQSTPVPPLPSHPSRVPLAQTQAQTVKFAPGTAKGRNKLRKTRFADGYGDDGDDGDGGWGAGAGAGGSRSGGGYATDRPRSRTSISTNTPTSAQPKAKPRAKSKSKPKPQPETASEKRRSRRASRAYAVSVAAEAAAEDDGEEDDEGWSELGYVSDAAAVRSRAGRRASARTEPNSRGGLFRLLVPRPLVAPPSAMRISSPQPLAGSLPRPRSRVETGGSDRPSWARAMDVDAIRPRSRVGAPDTYRLRTSRAAGGGERSESSSGTETPEPRTPSSGGSTGVSGRRKL